MAVDNYFVYQQKTEEATTKLCFHFLKGSKCSHDIQGSESTVEERWLTLTVVMLQP